MPTSTDLDVSPYFDDFFTEAKANSYYRILYKPRTAVQARELTQVQTMLQDQVEKYGNWSFQSGDIVYGVAINDLPVMPFVFLQDFQSNGALYSEPDLIDTVAVNSANLQALVLSGNGGLVSNYPNTTILYVKYVNTGTGGERIFSNTDSLQFIQTTNTGNVVAAQINVFSNTVANTISVGNAHGVSVGTGVIFINGTFVEIPNTMIGIVNAYGTFAANNVVGLQVTENVVTAAQDANLYDNAQGYSNFNAPGADRLQMELSLTVLTSNAAANAAGVTPLIWFSDGGLSRVASHSKLHSALADAIYKRLYEGWGNFVVNHFPVDTVTTVNSVVATQSANTMLARIGAGRGYAAGVPVGVKKLAYTDIPRGISTRTINGQVSTFNYGEYFVLNELAGTFDIRNDQPVFFYDTAQQVVTNWVNFSSSSYVPVGNVVGNAFVRCLTYSSGTPGTNTALYFLHVYNVQMANGVNLNQIKSVFANNFSVGGVGDLAVPRIIGQADGLMLFGFGATAIQKLRDSSNNNNTQYIYKRRSSVTMQTNGQVSMTLTSTAPGGTETLPYNVGLLSQQQASQLILTLTSNGTSNVLVGSMNVSSVGVLVRGNGTTFTNHFAPGDQFVCNGNTTVRTVVSVTDDTHLLCDQPFPVSGTSQTYIKSYLQGKIIPIGNISNTGPTSYVNDINSTSISINTGQIANTALNCILVHDVLRSGVVPASKIINKGRFIKIDTTTNPRGPWGIGFTDVHQLTGVWACPNSTSYSISGLNVLPFFYIGDGSTDAVYRPTQLHCSGFDTTIAPYLLVQCDYFSVDVTSGVSVFTVESYPVDDANTANTSAITTANFPCFTDYKGQLHNLRDFCDFRVPAVSTANDTGFCDNSNNTTTATAIAAATVNPANTITLDLPASGAHPPSFGQTLSASVTHYLQRQDILYITPDSQLQVKVGTPSINVRSVTVPEHGLVLAGIYVPPYPSLTTDQLDKLSAINRTSARPNRDTRAAVLTQATQQRRFTMHDIGLMDRRLTRLENFIALNWLEQRARDEVITDEDGNPKTKTGIFCEGFKDFDTSDVSCPEFACGMDTDSQLCRSRLLRELIGLTYNVSNSVNVQQTGRCLTLPYTSVPILTQPYASTTVRAPPTVYSWVGTLSLFNPTTNAPDTVNYGSLTVVNATDGPKTLSFAKSPFNSLWGDWRTTKRTTTTTPNPIPPDTKLTGFTQSVNTSTLYQAWGQNGDTPPQRYIQAHLAVVSNAMSFGAPPNAVSANTIISKPAFGLEGDGVVSDSNFSRG